MTLSKKKEDKSIIYMAYSLTGCFYVTKYKVLKETDKQYQCEGKKINKCYLNNYTSSGTAYAFSKGKAVSLVKDYIKNSIGELSRKISLLEETLAKDIIKDSEE